MKLTLDENAKLRIAAKLPEGRSVDDIRIVQCSAQIVTEDLDERDKALIASEVELAGGPPLISGGVPTIMRVVAWLAHEGINKNRLGFVADDFGPAADRIREPNFLVMDWNHSAVQPWSFDQKAIGVWYKAEKRWDPNAKDGKGAYGILAYGVVWSWAFPEYANTMLAEQARNGKIDFSMACLPETVEVGRDADGYYEIAHRPVFLTLSALDVPPADPDAIGRGEEGSDDPHLESRLRDELSALQVAALESPNPAEPVPAAADMTEEVMDELKEQLAAMQAELAEANARLAQLNDTETKLAEATAKVAELETKLTEASIAFDALRAEADAATAQVAAVTEELESAKGQLAEIAAKEAEAAKVARLATRLAELPEAYRQALERRSEEDRKRLEAKWAEMEDADWSEFKTEIAVAHAGFSYVRQSQLEGGNLPLGAGAGDDIASLVSAIKK